MGCGNASKKQPMSPVKTSSAITMSIKSKYLFNTTILKTTYGEVCEGTHVDTKEKRIIKSIKREAIEDSSMLKQEYEIMCKLDHPNITRIFELFDDPKDEYIYITMKLLKGSDILDKVYAQQFLEMSCIKNYISNIVEAIAFIHGKGIVHRKLTPSSIFLDRTTGQEVVMITNFSMARYVKADSTYTNTSDSPICLAPEVHKSKSYSAKSDVWSIGIISFLLLTGQLPYKLTKESNIPEIMMKTPINKELLSTFPTLKPEAIDFLSKALDINVSSRSSSAELLKHPFLKQDPNSGANISTEGKLEIGAAFKAFYKANKIEKEIYRFLAMASELDNTERQLRDFFKNADKSNDGKVTKQELIEGITKNHIKLPVTEDELAKAFDEADVDKSGSLSYSEFITLFINKEHLSTESNLRAAFNELDKDGNGFITKEDLAGIKGAEQVISQIDKSKDGKITVEELIAFMKNKKSE